MAENKKSPRTKEDVMAAMDKVHSKIKSREKLTGEDLSARLAAKKAAREQKSGDQPKRDTAAKLRIGVGVFLLLATGVVAVAGSSASEGFTVQTKENDRVLATLSSDLAYVTPDVDPKAQSAKLDAQLAEARAAGEKVTALQQEFGALMYGASREELPDNGAPGKLFLKSVEHRKELAPLFHPDTFILDNTEAYLPNSVEDFDPTEVDPRFPWFVMYTLQPTLPDGKVDASKFQQVADPSKYSWRMASVIPSQAGDPSKADVTWLAQDEAGDLLAWASSTYSYESKNFGQLSVGRTTIGDRHSYSVPNAYVDAPESPSDSQKKEG